MLISSAYAQAPAAGAADGGLGAIMGSPLIVMALMFAVMYFIVIRPQMKQAKKQKEMIAALQKGDEVVALGGLLGKIVELDEQYVTLNVAAETQIIVQRASVQLPLPKGTIKSIK